MNKIHPFWGKLSSFTSLRAGAYTLLTYKTTLLTGAGWGGERSCQIFITTSDKLSKQYSVQIIRKKKYAFVTYIEISRCQGQLQGTFFVPEEGI